MIVPWNSFVDTEQTGCQRTQHLQPDGLLILYPPPIIWQLQQQKSDWKYSFGLG